MISLKKTHLALVVLLTLLSPVISILSAYYKAQDTAHQELLQLEIRLEQTFVKKDDFQSLNKKIDRLSDDIAEVKGYLKIRR